MRGKNIVKYTIEDLAMFGGVPAFSEPLHVGRPNIGNRERLLERFNDLLDRKWLSNNGPYEKEFERIVADHVGSKHCIAVCNGTIALQLAVRALGCSGEVIIPSFTFIATAHALQWQDITPVFCDIDPESHNIDPAEIERLITPRTTGILGVHLWGRPCDIEALEEIGRRNNLKVAFDAAHAFGCSYRGCDVGGRGDATIYSFHATKFVNSFEGGAITTNNDELADKLRLMRNFGFTDYDTVVHVGTNGKMSEISAAMGLTSIESIDEYLDSNLRNYRRYREELQGMPGIRLLENDPRERSNYQYIVIEVDKAVAGASRDQLMEILHAENVRVRRYFYPGCHRAEPYCTTMPEAPFSLQTTEAIAQRVLVFPTGTSVTTADVTTICEIIRLTINNSRQTQQRLNQREES
jgi:dTDP-4-amino-4,6-dideoxygalactose transaminase